MNHYLKTPTVRWNEACKYLRSFRRLNGNPPPSIVKKVADEHRILYQLLDTGWKSNKPHGRVW